MGRREGDDRGLVPANGATHAPALGHGALWCALGTFLCALAGPIGGLVSGYGLYELTEPALKRGKAAAAFSVAAVSATLIVLVPAASGALVTTVAACAAYAACKRFGRVDTASVVLISVLCGLAGMGIDAALSASAGSSLVADLSDEFGSVVREATGQGIEGTIAADQLTGIFRALWPFAYVAQAGIAAGAAAIGCKSAERRLHGSSPAPRLASYDAPLWCVGVVASGFVLMAASRLPFPGAGSLLVVGACALMTMRVVFAVQGLAVLASKLGASRGGCLLRVLAYAVAAWLELMVMAVTIAGLVDVWANFRKLPRGRAGA